MAQKTTRGQVEYRAQVFAKMLTTGSTRRECLQHASDEWGVTDRTADAYIRAARDLIRSDWDDVARDQLAAELLSQYADLQRKARETNQLSVALGAINGAARLAKLIQ